MVAEHSQWLARCYNRWFDLIGRKMRHLRALIHSAYEDKEGEYGERWTNAIEETKVCIRELMEHISHTDNHLMFSDDIEQLLVFWKCKYAWVDGKWVVEYEDELDVPK